jgi:antitoxin ParD1/3/4
MKLITIHLPEPYIQDLDELVDKDFYPNRAEAIRIAVRDMLVNELWERRILPEDEIRKKWTMAPTLK